jgi:type II secretory pathway predicted ATPase ExeA
MATAPFRAPGAGRGLHVNPVHEEALARLDYLVENRCRLGLLLGAPGTGKTTMLDHFARQLTRRGARAVRVNLLCLDREELAWRLADGLGVHVEPHQPAWRVWRDVFDRIDLGRYEHLDLVLLFDDVHEAESGVLMDVVRLVQWQPDAEGRLTIVVAADSARVDLIGRRLLELSELRIDLFPWDLEDTAQFVSRSVPQAGREQPAFDDRAIREIHERAQGVPRRVRNLAELALLAAAGQGVELVDPDTVVAVSRELATPIPLP